MQGVLNDCQNIFLYETSSSMYCSVSALNKNGTDCQLVLLLVKIINKNPKSSKQSNNDKKFNTSTESLKQYIPKPGAV